MVFNLYPMVTVCINDIYLFISHIKKCKNNNSVATSNEGYKSNQKFCDSFKSFIVLLLIYI